MIRPTITVKRGAKFFILEDSDNRCAWFREILRSVRYYRASTYEEAKRLFHDSGPFDIYFLDHDLGLLDPFGVPEEVGTGSQFAQFLAQTGQNTGKNVVIHSWNEAGVKRMLQWLPHATALRFGSFDLKVE